MKKNTITLTFEQTSKNRILETAVCLFLLVCLCAVYIAVVIPSLHTPAVITVWGSLVCLGILWLISYIVFYRDTDMHILKNCSLQFIVSGLLAVVLMIVIKPHVAFMGTTLSIIIIESAVILITALRYKDLHVIFYVSFLILPYCILSGIFYLITGFVSAFLLLISLFNGGISLETGNSMDDSDYFGNSGGRN